MPNLEPCILWTKSKNNKGYGTTWYDGSFWLAHRLAYYKSFGPIPDGMCVCHKCDNPSCINPHHLFLGTHRDNANDRKQKGRNANQKGSKSVLSKLTNRQVRYIRQSNYTCQYLADMFGMSKSQINKIKNFRCWNG